MWDHLPGECSSRSSTRSLRVLRDRRRPRRARLRPGRPDQHRHAAVLLRARRPAAARRGDRRDQATRSRRPTASAGALVVERNLAAVDARWPRCTRCASRPTTRRRRHRRPPVPADAPDFVAAGHRRACSPARATCCRCSACRSTARSRPAPRGTRSAARRRDPDLGPGSVHRLRPVRARLPPRRDPDEGLRPRALDGAAGRLPDQGVPVARPPGSPADDPGRTRRLHRLRRLRRRLPCARQDRGEAQGDQHGADRRAPRRRAATLGLLPRDPRARPHRRSATTGQGLADAPAAVRVLRRLRRMRRDAVPQAPDASCSATGSSSPTPPVARRSTAATCRRRRGRRTPTAAAPPGPTRCSRTTPSSGSASASASSTTSARPRAPARTSSPRRRSGARRRAPRRAIDQSKARSPSSAQRESVELRARLVGASTTPDARRAARPRRRARRARASGSSAATAGPTTSASAASTTCWPAAAT